VTRSAGGTPGARGSGAQTGGSYLAGPLGAPGRWRRALREEAATTWRLPPLLAELVFLVPFVGLVVLGLARASLPVYQFLVAEDSLLEWAQVAGYLVACAAAAGVAWRLRASRQSLLGALFALLALGSLFIAGEEIAWGQRLLGFATPEELAAVNHQNEVTVHNVSGLQTAFNVVLLVAGAYAGIGPWIARRRGAGVPSERMKLLMPPLFLSSFFFVVFLYKLIRFVLLPEPAFTIVKYGEWPELCMGLGVATFAALTIRRLREGPTRAIEGGGR